MSHEHHPFSARRARKAAGAATALMVVAGGLVVATPSAQAAKEYTVVAHRGDRDKHPENSVKAFVRAAEKGADVIEMDVAFSSSGYPVIMHDSTLDRTTDCSGKVSSKSRTQLAKCELSNDEPVPTLRGALSAISKASSSVKVMLHMKVTPTTKLADRTMDDVSRYGMTSRTYVLASNSETFKKMKSEGAKHFAYIFNTSAGWDKDYEIMIPYETRMSSSGISKAHDRGNKVWPVENHPDSLKELLEAGRVDGILADHLDSLLDLLSPSASARSKDAAHEHAIAPDDHRDTWEDEMTRPRE